VFNIARRRLAGASYFLWAFVIVQPKEIVQISETAKRRSVEGIEKTQKVQEREDSIPFAPLGERRRYLLGAFREYLWHA